MTDTRTIEKIRKLLALANDKGATEAEASLAAERAQDLMNQHGLEMASLDLTGEGEAREKGAATAVGLGREAWAESLMSAVAESCYVTAWTRKAGRRLEGFTLIGRKSAVVSCEIMFSYLSRTVIRLSRSETGSQRYFRFGAAERIAQRIVARHRDELRKQRETADAQRTNNANTGGTALVIVLEDYAQKERRSSRPSRRSAPIARAPASSATAIASTSTLAAAMTRPTFAARVQAPTSPSIAKSPLTSAASATDLGKPLTSPIVYIEWVMSTKGLT